MIFTYPPVYTHIHIYINKPLLPTTNRQTVSKTERENTKCTCVWSRTLIKLYTFTVHFIFIFIQIYTSLLLWFEIEELDNSFSHTYKHPLPPNSLYLPLHRLSPTEITWLAHKNQSQSFKTHLHIYIHVCMCMCEYWNHMTFVVHYCTDTTPPINQSITHSVSQSVRNLQKQPKSVYNTQLIVWRGQEESSEREYNTKTQRIRSQKTKRKGKGGQTNKVSK